MDFKHNIKLANVSVYALAAQGGVSPKMALGSMPTRPALLIKLEDSQGCFGWGEIWANFPPRANIHKAHLVEDVIVSLLCGLNFTDPREVQTELREKLSNYFLHIGQPQVFEHILAGLDVALWDLALRHAEVSFAEFMSIKCPLAQSYATSINAEDLEQLIPHHAGLGQTHFKLKIGFAEHGNTHIIERADKLRPAGAQIMVDSNQSWNLEQAKQALQAIEDFSLFFAEEPLPANAPLQDWEALAKSTHIPLAAGENIYGLDNFLSMTDAGLRYVQPDVAKWGGLSGALELAQRVPDDVFVWPHFMGTAIGQVAALSVSAAIGDSSACEMDVNDNDLRTTLCGDVLTISQGKISLPTSPGLTVPPKPDQLQRFHVGIS